jgi:triacylglycerol lipase
MSNPSTKHQALSTKHSDALLAARACALSYQDFNSLGFDVKVAQMGFADYATIDIAGVQACCMANARTILVCFRGTDSRPDWLSNAMASKTPMHHPDWRVHTGFLRTLLVVEQPVLDFILPRLQPPAPCSPLPALLITGHSLGGAMAVLFAMRHFFKAAQIITFGCPRVGNEAFCRLFNYQYPSSLRFVNNNDTVPRLPLKSMGYSHVWAQYWFDAQGKLHPNHKPDPVSKFANAVGTVTRRIFGGGIRDHDMTTYLRLVETAFKHEDTKGRKVTKA